MGTNKAVDAASKADLVYALRQLVEAGKVKEADLGTLLTGRQARIATLEAELKRLRGDEPPPLEWFAATPTPITQDMYGKILAGNEKILDKVPEKFDAHIVGKFGALVQHHISPARRKVWYDQARKNGFARTLTKLETLLRDKQHKENRMAQVMTHCPGVRRPKVHEGLRTTARSLQSKPTPRVGAAKFDPYVVGKFSALLQHRVSKRMRDHWLDMAREKGFATMLPRLMLALKDHGVAKALKV